MKNFDKVRSELGKQFGGGAVFSEWEREFGIANTSLPAITEEEATVYYKKVEDVIKDAYSPDCLLDLKKDEYEVGILQGINNKELYFL